MKRFLFPIVLCLLAACVENTPCVFPSEDSSMVVCTLAAPVPLTRTDIGASESSIGDAVVDGYQRALLSSALAPAAALNTASDVQSGGLCLPAGASGTSLPAGPLTWQRLRDALPTADLLVVEDMTLQMLFNTLEHGVAGPEGAIDGSTGRLVEAAGITYVVDCSQPPESVTRIGGNVVRTAEGRRVVSLTLHGQTFVRSDETADTELIPIALPESLAQGGDGFVDLRDAWNTQQSSAYAATDVAAFDALVELLRTRQEGGGVTLQVDGRITLLHCGGP